MDFRTEASRLRQTAAENALSLARELEAGRAVAPFQERFGQLRLADESVPVRAVILATRPEAAQALLSEIIGHDYNVCKVVVPARLGYSEVHLQERGFLLDTGGGTQEFDDVGSFLRALQQTQLLLGTEEGGLEPLRVRLKGPEHLDGLCLLIPHSLDALQRKPALLSALTDQADWVFLAGDQQSTLSAEQRQTMQLLLDHVTGLQNVLIAADAAASPERPLAEEWWKGWKVGLSLGLVRQGTEQLRTRLALLTAPGSELRHYLVESRLLRQLDTTLLLMEEELQQSHRTLANRLYLGREGLLPDSGTVDARKLAEGLRARLAEESDNLLRALERDTRSALAPDGEISRRLLEVSRQLSTDDIEQTPAEVVVKLTLAGHVMQRLAVVVTESGRRRFAADVAQFREGFECSVRDVEASLEKTTGVRHKLAVELPDEAALWQTLPSGARTEIRYRGEMPRPTLASRFQAARQSIMGLMILGTVLGGAATLTGDSAGGGGDVRSILYALMLPLLIVGFLWTYVSFRKKERLTLEKEIEKLQEGVNAELRRAQQELLRELQTTLASAVQRAVRGVQQQIDAAIEKIQALRQRETDDLRKRQAEQQRSLEQRVTRLRQSSQQLSAMRGRLSEAQKLHQRWLAAWIERFNKGQA